MPHDMGENVPNAFSVRKHPPVTSIEEVMTFRINQLVTINERAGHNWSERLFDLKLNEWRMLALIVAHGPARSGTLANRTYMDKSQSSRVIRSLKRKKLVVETKDPDDGRAVALKPTTKGHGLYSDMMQQVMLSNERILSALTQEEAETFSTTLDKLIAHTSALLDARLAADEANTSGL